MKQRLEATHFIEVWRNRYDRYSSCTSILDIRHLQGCLMQSHNLNIETIAIWKIKYK